VSFKVPFVGFCAGLEPFAPLVSSEP